MINNFEAWITGKTAPAPWKSHAVGSPDGAVLEQDNSGNLTLAVLMRAPTMAEVMLVKSGAVETVCYTNAPFWLGILRFAEDKNTSFEVTFDITKYSVEERQARINSIKSVGSIVMPLIDTQTGMVKSVRFATLPAAFLESLYLCVSDPLPADFQHRYTAWLNQVFQSPTNTLWSKGKKTGCLGE